MRIPPLRNWSLAARESTVIVLLLIVILGSVFVLIHYRFCRLADAELNRTAVMAVELAAERINQKFPAVMSAADELAVALRNGPERNPAELMEFLTESFQRLHESIPPLCAISIAYDFRCFGAETDYFMIYVYQDADGRIRQVRRGGPDDPYTRFDWFVIPKLRNQSVWSEPYFDRVADTMMTTYSQILRDREGKFIGIAGFDLSLERLNRLAERADVFGYGQEMILSRFGRIIAYPENPQEDSANPELRRDVTDSTIFSYADNLENNLFTEDRDARLLRDVGRAMLSGQKGMAAFSQLSPLTNGRERLYYAPIPTPGWSLAVSYPEGQLTANLSSLERNLRLLSLLGILLMLLAVVVITRRQSAPLARLTRAAREIGGGNFHVELPPVRGEDEIGQLTRAFGSMQQALAHHTRELQANAAARQKIESELQVAREIQMDILPRLLPPLPETEEFSLYASLNPARAVGGDLYDFFYLDEQHFCFVIGDVSGKGIPAALFMSMTQTLQRSEAERSRTPAGLTTRINTFLADNNDALMFVTYFVGVLDCRTGIVTFCNAGHNPPRVLRADGTLETLAARHGSALGIIKDQAYGEATVTLDDGDMIVLYTDGVTEALNPEKDEFGSEALDELLLHSAGRSPSETGAAILTAVKEFARGAEQADDITLLLLKFNRKEKVR